MEESLIRLASVLQRVHNEDELLSELINEVQETTKCDSVDVLYRGGGDGLVLRASTLIPEFNNRLKLGKGVGLCGHALLTNQPIFLGKEAHHHPRYAKYPGIDERVAESLAIMLLQIDEKPPFGVVLLRKTDQWPMTSSVKKRLTHFAGMISQCIVGFQNCFSAGTKSTRFGALSEVTKTIVESPYLEEILQLLVNLTAQQFNYKVCTVRLLDETRGELVLRATQATARAYQKKRAIKLGESIAGRAITLNRPIVVPDVQSEQDYIGHDLAAEQGLRSMICVPLTIQGRPIGVMTCYTEELRDFPADEIKALETLAKQAAISIEHAKLQVRNTLMQEMHHRVKNNLQQVASLLRLQMRLSHYKSLEEALNDSLSRILAISSVHDLLSREDLDHVGMRSIAETLVQHQQNSFIMPDRHILFKVTGDDVFLSMNQATQISLVLNELVMNSIEHGFKACKKGEVHVNIEDKEGLVSVWVSNNGDRLPENFDATKTNSLGLSIVDSLIRSMGGKFKISEVMGWAVAEVKFQRSSGE